MSWFVIRTATRREQRAMASLEQLNFKPYLPMEAYWQRHMGRKTRKEAPLFAGYLFLDCDADELPDVRDAEGVHQILRNNGRYVTVPPMHMAAMILAEWLNEFDRTCSSTPKRTFKAGDPVKVVGGQFQGFPGTIIEARPRDRMAILISIFGRTSPMELPVAQIEIAA